MADASGQTPSPIFTDLLSHGHEFSFVQVMRLARKVLGAGGSHELPEIPWQDRLKVRSRLSMSFPAADVASINLDGSGLLVENTFLRLYDSLPAFYCEDLMDEVSCDSSVSRDFLEIFHQRLYQLYFECWSKYRLFIRVAEERNPLDRERLFCLIGLGVLELRNSVINACSLLRYTGLLTQFPRSAEGLQTLLRDALGVIKLVVEQCVLRKVTIPADQRMSLGISGMSLGMNTVLGSVTFDRMGKFRIVIGPLKRKEFRSFLPDGPNYAKLVRLIKLYIIDPFDFDLKITLAANEAEPIRLGDPNGGRLGWDAVCFSGETYGEVSIILPLEEPGEIVSASAEDATDDSPEPSSLIELYQQELARLRELISRYVEKHPEMAPLVSGHMADPGVERLMEGTAFLWALLRMKLDDDFPEVIHKVMDVIQPDSLRPVPASTIVVFTPKPNCTEPQLIPVGTELKSVPVDGTECRFTTCYPVEIHPLAITNVSFVQPSGKPPAITLNLKLTGIALSNWKIHKLRLFLAGERNDALNLYLVLMRYLKRIVITPLQGDGQPFTLDATQLKPVGFEDADLLFPTTSAAASHQLLWEYFIQPDKFLFLDLILEKWQRRGEGMEFEIRFELDKLPFELHQVNNDDFGLFGTPAVNVFKHRSKTIVTDSKCSEYQIKPAVRVLKHYNIYSIDAVSAFLNYTKQKISLTSGHHGNPRSGTEPIYHVKRRNAHITSGIDTFISIETPQKTFSLPLTSLVAELTCTNGNLPEKLQIGDICRTTDSSPKFCKFVNCKPVTRPASIDPGNNTLWRLYSLCSLNISLLNVRSLRAALEIVAQSYNRDYTSAMLNSKRIQGITDFKIKAMDRLLGRSMLRGWEIKIKLNHEAYSSPGDLYMFGALLDCFLRAFTSQSCFTQTIIEDDQNKNTYEWPAKMGRRILI